MGLTFFLVPRAAMPELQHSLSFQGRGTFPQLAASLPGFRKPCLSLQRHFPGSGNLPAACNHSSRVWETFLQLAASFPGFGKPSRSLQRQFPGTGRLAAGCRGTSTFRQTRYRLQQQFWGILPARLKLCSKRSQITKVYTFWRQLSINEHRINIIIN